MNDMRASVLNSLKKIAGLGQNVQDRQKTSTVRGAYGNLGTTAFDPLGALLIAGYFARA
ncbi:MAG: hypothetical protein ACYTFF_13235 [Planctomycetota bacterium]|jgi:hypothetical protein